MKYQDNPNNGKSNSERKLQLLKADHNLEIFLEIWSRTQQLAMVVSFIGLFLAAAIGAAGYLLSSGLARMIHLSGAMGCLMGSAIGINVLDRLRKKARIPWFGILIFLGTVIAGLLATHMKAKEFGVNILWPPLVGAAFSSVMTGIVWRLRSSLMEYERYRELLEQAKSQL